ncbi:MAG: DNA double-strand break repair nuclease NurA [Candidatus Nanohaloarchaea archaeon]
MVGIREAAEQLSERQQELDSLEEKFAEHDTIETDDFVREEKLRHPVEKKVPETVAGIDGGIVKKRYSVGDVVAVRAVAALLEYSSGRLEETDYIPSRSPEPDFEVFESTDDRGMERNAESMRLEKEAETVLEALGKASTVLMDGSVVPSYLEEDDALEAFNRLFERAEPGQLAGVVEDSYGLRISSLLEEKLGVSPGKTRDTLLMDAMLEKGERSFVRRYSESPVEHPVLQKLEDRHVNGLFTFYVKLSKRDLPLRIDYYGSPEEADDIAGKLMFLKASESYTVPAPVIEADKRAKVPQEYLKRFEKRFSPDLRRRDRRSF